MSKVIKESLNTLDKLQQLHMLKNTIDICIEADNCLTKTQCNSKKASANQLGFVDIMVKGKDRRCGERFLKLPTYKS